jgi:hypothetical protein
VTESEKMNQVPLQRRPQQEITRPLPGDEAEPHDANHEDVTDNEEADPVKLPLVARDFHPKVFALDLRVLVPQFASRGN